MFFKWGFKKKSVWQRVLVISALFVSANVLARVVTGGGHLCTFSADIPGPPAPAFKWLYTDIPDVENVAFLTAEEKRQVLRDLGEGEQYFTELAAKSRMKRKLLGRLKSVFQFAAKAQDRIQFAVQFRVEDESADEFTYQMLAWQVVRESSLSTSLLRLKEFIRLARESDVFSEKRFRDFLAGPYQAYLDHFFPIGRREFDLVYRPVDDSFTLEDLPSPEED